MNLEEILVTHAQQTRASKAPPAMAPDLLRDFLERYQAPNPFKVGDLVTPRSDSTLKRNGWPHIVVEVRHDSPPFFTGETSTADFGNRLDMRVAAVDGDGHIMCWWVEGFLFEPWIEPAS